MHNKGRHQSNLQPQLRLVRTAPCKKRLRSVHRGDVILRLFILAGNLVAAKERAIKLLST